MKIWFYPIVGVELNELNSNQFSSNFSNIFLLFESIELNEFRTNSNLTPPLSCSMGFRVSPLNVHPKRHGGIKPARFGRSAGNDLHELCQQL